MQEPSIIHNTFVIERDYPQPPEKVFAAFADPAKKRRWFAEGHSHEVEEFKMDFRVGGQEYYRSRFKEGTPFPGVSLTSEGSYQEIVVNRCIVSAATMAIGDQRISAALLTIELLPTASGTNLVCTHQAAFFEGADGPEMRKGGWQKLLDKLGSELSPA
jgi:uncharacterized protein YndB with AHSA1/START domain